MRNQMLKLFALFAIVSPLALAGCHSDEHPGDDAGHTSSDASEHPEQSGGAQDEHPE